MAKLEKKSKKPKAPKTFGQLHPIWLKAHADVWAVYGEEKDPSYELNKAEDKAYEAALSAQATNIYDIEKKIEMILAYPCKNFIPDESVKGFHAVVQDLHGMMGK